MANSNSDINAARKIYSVALNAAEAAGKWQTKQEAQVEDEYQSAIQLAESTQQVAQERAQQIRDKSKDQAARILADINKAVTEGDRLIGKINLGRGVGAHPYLPSVQPGTLPAKQVLAQAQRDSVDALHSLKNALSELHRIRNANREQLKWIFIATATGILILLFVVLIHH